MEIADIVTVKGNTDEKDIKLIRNVHVFAVEKFESYTSCVKSNRKVALIDEVSIPSMKHCKVLKNASKHLLLNR